MSDNRPTITMSVADWTDILDRLRSGQKVATAVAGRLPNDVVLEMSRRECEWIATVNRCHSAPLSSTMESLATLGIRSVVSWPPDVDESTYVSYDTDASAMDGYAKRRGATADGAPGIGSPREALCLALADFAKVLEEKQDLPCLIGFIGGDVFHTTFSDDTEADE